MLLSATSAYAERIEVEMLNKNADGDRMVFSQELIEASVGDEIVFVPTDKSHNAQSVKGATPEGQDGFRGAMNQEVTYTVTEAGLTAVVCLPHQSMGMVAVIVVDGNTDNADSILAARVPGRGGQKIQELVEQAQSM
jgi:pseudoazurin